MKLHSVACIREGSKEQHLAFGDLIFCKGLWLATFREGDGHVSSQAAIRLLWKRSPAEDWIDGGLLEWQGRDLRDPHFTVSEKGECWLLAACVDRSQEKPLLETFAWEIRCSPEGLSPDWARAKGWRIAQPGHWLWRLAWHGGTGYGISYGGGGVHWYALSGRQEGTGVLLDRFSGQYVNESGIVFSTTGRAYVLLRRDPRADSDGVLSEENQAAHAYFGVADPPYQNWVWTDFGERIGGPCLIWNARRDGLYAGFRARSANGDWGTELAELSLEGEILQRVQLPSGGDNSYPGLVLHDQWLYGLYYSSHEEERGTSMYLCQVDVSQ